MRHCGHFERYTHLIHDDDINIDPMMMLLLLLGIGQEITSYYKKFLVLIKKKIIFLPFL